MALFEDEAPSLVAAAVRTALRLRLGAATTPPLVAWLMQARGWRQALLITSVPSLLLVALWHGFARDRPAQHPAVSSSELDELAQNPPEAAGPPVTVARLVRVLADPQILAWTGGAVREAAEAAGRDPDQLTICVAASAYVGDDLPHQRDQVRWFGGMVGNHVADLVNRYGEDQSLVPKALTDYIKARQGYDYQHHGKAGNPSTDFVPDEVIERFCVLGPASNHVARIKELATLGADQFAIYLMHDQMDQTLEAYGRQVIPAFQA